MGTLYLIHFETPFGHARHYRGWYQNPRRIEHHRRGTGANLMRHVRAAGIRWIVAVTRPGTRTDERHWKEAHSASRYCPVCRGERPHVCYTCGKTYKYAGWLRRHNATIHGEEIAA